MGLWGSWASWRRGPGSGDPVLCGLSCHLPTSRELPRAGPGLSTDADVGWAPGRLWRGLDSGVQVAEAQTLTHLNGRANGEEPAGHSLALGTPDLEKPFALFVAKGQGVARGRGLGGMWPADGSSFTEGARQLPAVGAPYQPSTLAPPRTQEPPPPANSPRMQKPLTSGSLNEPSPASRARRPGSTQ